MEKRKYDLDKYADLHKEDIVRGVDGTEVTVRNHIPYEKKEELVHELLIHTIGIHEDSCAYTSEAFERMRLYMIAKYYTDIDTEDVETSYIADFLINNELVVGINEFINDDFDYTMGIYWHMLEAFMTTYEDDHSLKHALKTSFGFLFNGEDITETLAKAEASKDTIFSAINALNEKEKEKAEKVENGTLNIGGNVINFAKKKND